ncbi:MAG: PIN domain nuclease [Actinomycetota bacterium]|nr:PIN domain nuclease [Actinomycetota bacterium]
MILVDSSVWIDLLRGGDTAAGRRLAELATTPDVIATTEPVLMEVAAGAVGQIALQRIERLFSSVPLLSVSVTSDFKDAALLYRAAREAGFTVRALTDCLIAAVALRTASTVLHKDADYVALASIAPLRHEDVR